jgi:predicted nucleic acid-binding protein
MKYLLDTNICVYFLNQRPDVVARMNQAADEDLGVSIVTIGELQFGAYNSQKVEHNLNRINIFRQMVQTTYLTLEITEAYAKIKANLRKAGCTVDDFDILIGATAIVNNLTLVTNNTRHFENIAGLSLADWSAV